MRNMQRQAQQRQIRTVCARVGLTDCLRGDGVDLELHLLLLLLHLLLHLLHQRGGSLLLFAHHVGEHSHHRGHVLIDCRRSSGCGSRSDGLHIVVGLLIDLVALLAFDVVLLLLARSSSSGSSGSLLLLLVLVRSSSHDGGWRVRMDGGTESD